MKSDGASGNDPPEFDQPGPSTAQQVAREFQHYAGASSYDSCEVNGKEDSLATIETRKPIAEMPDERKAG